MADIQPGDDLTAALLNQLISTLFSDKASANTVATAGTTTSLSFVTSLTTGGAGPSVTLTSAGSMALVLFSAAMFSSAATGGNIVSVGVSGATTLAPSTGWSAKITGPTASGVGARYAQFVRLPITPGSNTFYLAYAVGSASTGTFSDRDLLVIAP